MPEKTWSSVRAIESTPVSIFPGILKKTGFAFSLKVSKQEN
jgi:hypothetical protein